MRRIRASFMTTDGVIRLHKNGKKKNTIRLSTSF